MNIIEAGKQGKWHSGRALLPACFLLAGLLITGWAALRVKVQADENVKREVDFVCSEMQDKIIERFRAHAQLLRSAEAFFAGSDDVSRQKWQSFCAHQGIGQYLHGIQGLGFALLIPRENVAQHIQEIRAEGFPEYQVRPEGERALYSAIIYLEPFVDRNLRAFGYDMLSEPVRRTAMERARDLNEPVLSGKIRLVQETTRDVQEGTLMYLPVYRKNMPVETVDQRRAAIRGWVYSPYRMTDLMDGILGRMDLKNALRIHLKVFDGELATPAALLYDSQPATVQPVGTGARLSFQRRVVVADRPWTLRFTAGHNPVTYGVVWLVLLGGTTISLLLAGFIFSLLGTEFKARQLALQLTQDLRRLYAELEKRIEERTADLAASRLEALNMMEEAVKARHLTEESNQRLNQEIDEHHKVSQELKRSEIRFRNYFNLPLHGRAIISPEKDWVEVNDRLCAMLGYSRDELIKMSWSGMTYPDDILADIEQFERMLSGQIDQYVVEKRLVRKDGNVIWIKLAAGCERKPDGKVDYFTAVMDDITNHKKLESEQLKIEELSRQINKDKSLGRMAGAIAHHFNNQLHVVLGYLNMVIDELPPGDARAADLVTARQAAKRASSISSHMITYLGQQQVVLVDVDIAEQVLMTLPVFQEGKPTGVNVELVVPSPGLVIKADVKQIQQSLTNLVTNAFESIGDRAGTVHLSVKTVSSTDIPPSRRFPADWTASDHSYACLKVMDSGCGIRQTDFDKLFEPFFSTKSAGRGMGLPVVLGIVRAHKGGITVEDRNGGGSVFSVFFPLSAQNAPRPVGDVAKARELGPGGTVLVVEDDELVSTMTAAMLRRQGYAVLQARDGIEAVEIFGQHQDDISCLLSDLVMPRMDGWATIAALRAIRHDLPVVLASGYDEASVMAGEHPELPDAFLSKPYTFQELENMIGRAIAQRNGSA